MIIHSLQFLVGAIFLFYGAEFLINSSKTVAAKFKIDPVIIGITLVAFGTSLPELIVSILANLKDDSGLVIPALQGKPGIFSSICSILFSLIKFAMAVLLIITSNAATLPELSDF